MTTAGTTQTTPVRSRSRHYRQLTYLLPLTVVVAVAVVGPLFLPFDPERVVASPSLPPGGEHLLGTDSSGMDVFSRTVAAARLNLLIAGLVMAASTLLGIIGGLCVGMTESSRGTWGLVGRATSRFFDLVQALPAVVIALVIVSFFGASVTTMTISLTVILFPTQVRLVRTEVLRVRQEPYLDAARMGGLGEIRLTIRHVLPNSASPALENASFIFGVAITLTATLGFLGVGIPQPTPEWGSMIARGAPDASVGTWWPATAPAFALCMTVASVATAARHFLRGSEQ